MNNYLEAIKSAYDEYLSEVKRAVDGLSKAELYRQPNRDSNPVGWIAWHMARVEDFWINGVLAGKEQVWNAGGWDKKFGMDPADRGAGQTIERVKSMPQIEGSDLVAYFDAVRAETGKVIASLTEDQLSAMRPHPRGGEVTGVWIVGHIIVEESQHTGQAAMVRGMLRGFGQ